MLGVCKGIQWMREQAIRTTLCKLCTQDAVVVNALPNMIENINGFYIVKNKTNVYIRDFGNSIYLFPSE